MWGTKVAQQKRHYCVGNDTSDTNIYYSENCYFSLGIVMYLRYFV